MKNPDIIRQSQVPIHTMSEQRAHVFDMRPDKDWLNPISMSTLKRAVERKQRTVILNGVDYTISYGHYIRLPASRERRELVQLKRIDGALAPFGYVSVKKLQQFEFESSSK